MPVRQIGYFRPGSGGTTFSTTTVPLDELMVLVSMAPVATVADVLADVVVAAKAAEEAEPVVAAAPWLLLLLVLVLLAMPLACGALDDC